MSAVLNPQPLTRAKPPPEFPTEALPDWLKLHVQQVAHFTQTPTDLAGTVALGVLAAAAGGRAVTEVRPGWREPLNLYVVTALDPGNRKSAVFRAMTTPLRDVEQNLADQTRAAIVESATTKQIAERAAESAKQAAGRTNDAERRAELTADAIAAAAMAESIVVPTLPRLLADDITPESAASMLAEQGGRLTIASAEGGLFDMLAGRYSSGVPNLDWALKGHAGDTLRVDRKGRPAEYVASHREPAPASQRTGPTGRR